MATVVDTLVTRYVADTKSFDSGTARMTGSLRSLASNAAAAINPVTAVTTAVLAAATAVLAAATAYVALNAAVIQVGMTAFREFGQYDALAKSLEAVEGNAKNAADAMKVLRDVAKLPGIGLQEAIRGFTSLRLNGMGGAEAERTIRAVGNANALAGGGMEEFGRVMLAITQIMRNPTGEELNQLSEAGIPGHRIIKEAFGTSDMGELKKLGVTSAEILEALIVGLEKMPKAADSAKNAIENLQASVSLSLASIGEGMAKGGVTDMISGFTRALEDLETNGGFQLIGEAIAGVLDSLNPFNDSMRSLSDVLVDVGAGVAGLLAGLAEVNRALMAWVTGDFKNMRLPQQIMADAMGAAILGSYRFASTVMFNRLRRTMEDDPELTSAGKAAEEENNRAVKHLAAIEANTREMIDVQRMILGGGQMARFGVTATELAGFRSGGGASSGEAQVIAGMRRMLFEMMSAAPRRGMG